MPTEVAPHLGGYISGEHGDPATWYPELWTWMVKRLSIKSVLDIGCGEGHSTRYFRKLGCDAMGIDGVKQKYSRVYRHDYTREPLVSLGNAVAYLDGDEVDLGWMCEFVEHLEERYLPNLVSTLRACRYVAMTHAFPGQLGHHHVNCRDAEYWKGFMAGIGFEFMPGLTQQARVVAGFNEDEYNHFVRSGMIFERRDG